MNRNEWLKRNQRTFCIMWKNKKKTEWDEQKCWTVCERARARLLVTPSIPTGDAYRSFVHYYYGWRWSVSVGRLWLGCQALNYIRQVKASIIWRTPPRICCGTESETQHNTRPIGTHDIAARFCITEAQQRPSKLRYACVQNVQCT